MSDKLKPSDDLDELSRFLDEMNAGRHPACADEETAELLAVADFIRKADIPVQPPRHILDQTVDRALAGLQAGKRQPSRIWMYSGVLGTAAAVILVVGLNLLPSWQQQVPVPAPTSVVVAPQQQTQPTSEPAAYSRGDSVDAARPPVTAPAAEQPVLPGSQPPAAPVPPQTTTPAAKSPDAPQIMAEVPRSGQSKSLYLPSEPSVAASKSAAPTVKPLILLGQVPDQVITDQEKGTLRQIFYKGTPQEIAVTQRLHPKNSAGQLKTAVSSLPEFSPDQPNPINTVRLMIAGQEVTIEGRQPKEDLMKIAESLSP
ncbi:MAG: hypothetical protein P4N59_32235 [Negativicutes bacterium]|nr:hypothetical protein [Negativicutes bacterium]